MFQLCNCWSARERVRRLMRPLARGTARLLCATLLLGGAVVSANAWWCGQEAASPELRSRVAELIKGLDSAKAAERQAAQAELIRLGPKVLPLLPPINAEGQSAEQKRRIQEVRTALGEGATKSDFSPSKITLNAKGVTLSDAVAAIQKQSGNQIVDLREEFGQEVTNPEFPADWNDKPFWEVLDEIASKTMVGQYLHTGERQLGLVMEPPKSMPTAYTCPLRIQLHQLMRRISYEERLKECVMQFEIAWEPRLRPILFELKPDDLEILDDQDRKISIETGRPDGLPDDSGGVLKSPVDGTVIRTDFFIRLAQPPKGAEKIRILRGKLGVLLPANVQTFQFADLAKTKGAKQESGNVSLTLERFREIESGLWSADVVLQFNAQSEAFESYETWFYENEAYLQRADGTRFPVNGGFTLTESGDGRIGIEYRFVDAPGKMNDYKFVYKSPSVIVRETVPFEMKEIELP